MEVIGQFSSWLVDSISNLWSAATTSWGVVGAAFIAVPLIKKIFNLFIKFLKGAI